MKKPRAQERSGLSNIEKGCRRRPCSPESLRAPVFQRKEIGVGEHNALSTADLQRSTRSCGRARDGKGLRCLASGLNQQRPLRAAKTPQRKERGKPMTPSPRGGGGPGDPDDDDELEQMPAERPADEDKEQEQTHVAFDGALLSLGCFSVLPIRFRRGWRKHGDRHHQSRSQPPPSSELSCDFIFLLCAVFQFISCLCDLLQLMRPSG